MSQLLSLPNELIMKIADKDIDAALAISHLSQEWKNYYEKSRMEFFQKHSIREALDTDDATLLKQLFKHKADPNKIFCIDDNVYTPLYYAIKHQKNIPLVEILLENGANPNFDYTYKLKTLNRIYSIFVITMIKINPLICSILCHRSKYLPHVLKHYDFKYCGSLCSIFLEPTIRTYFDNLHISESPDNKELLYHVLKLLIESEIRLYDKNDLCIEASEENNKFSVVRDIMYYSQSRFIPYLLAKNLITQKDVNSVEEYFMSSFPILEVLEDFEEVE